MTYLADYGAVLSLVVSTLVAWAAWSIKRVAEAGQTRLEIRIERIENALAHVAKPGEVAALRESLAELHGDIRALGAQIEALRQTTTSLGAAAERINDYLLHRGR